MDFLDRMVLEVKRTIANGFYDAKAPVAYPHRSLTEGLRSNSFSLIAVLERRSPTERELFQGDLEALASRIAQAGVHALSVVCEPICFGGRMEDLLCAKRQGLPVLYKDFVIDPVQIHAAKRFGADAVLLILALSDKGYARPVDQLIDIAHDLGLETVLEVFTSEEFRRAKDTESDIIGINNRNLKTLEVRISTTTLILLNEKPDRIVIAESGIRSRKDMVRLQVSGAKGALVGTAILKSPDPQAKIRELLGASDASGEE